MKSFMWLVIGIGWVFGAGRMAAGEILVFAAASLTESLGQIAESYERTTGEKVRFNFAASNVLAQQIRAGAPADIYFSADKAKMDGLEGGGFLAGGTRRDLLGNSLVIITAEEGLKISSATDLGRATFRRLVIGDPSAVPAGVYAKAWLERVGLWQALKPRVLPVENVRAALAVVEAGNAELGIVYKTDAGVSTKVRVVFEIPAMEGLEITYPAAVVKDSRNADAARRFLEYLGGKSATETFIKLGFRVVD